MRKLRSCISVFFVLAGLLVSHSQERRTEVCIDFRVNSTVIDSSYSDNAVRMGEMVDFLRDISRDSTVNIIEVSFCGAASPEGSYQLNRKLARGRLSALEKFIRDEVDIPDSLVTRNDSYIPWDYLKSQIEDSDLDRKEEVIAIIEEESQLVDYHRPETHIDNRILKLKELDGGRIWDQMNKLFFERMRNACAVVVAFKKELPPVEEPVVVPVIPEPVQEPAVEPEPVVEVVEPEPIPEVTEAWMRQLHVKTNAIGLGLAIANVAVEIDLGKHWSFTLPVYYSAWDYFKTTIKFRTLAVQPEVRYWFRPDNEGWFVGAHFGYAFYNLAWDGDYRYQDHDRDTPAMGGGIAAGYRTHLSRNKRWKMEFSLGGGVYPIDYDKFHNTKVTKEGLMVESSIKKTYWGLDQAAISIAYAFDLKKKGGKR